MTKKTRDQDEVTLEGREASPDEQRREDESPEATIDRLRQEVADLEDKWKRALAETQNVRRQSRLNEGEAVFQGARRVLESVIPVLDHFDLALGQDPSAVSAEQIIGGVRLIRDELLKALANQNVVLVEPSPGDDFDPNRHEAMMRQASDEVGPGQIVQVLQVGYAMGDRMLRPAKVVIAEEGQG